MGFGNHELSLSSEFPLFLLADEFSKVRESTARTFTLFGTYESAFQMTAHVALYAQPDFRPATVSAARRYVGKESFAFPVFHARSTLTGDDAAAILKTYPFLRQVAHRVRGDACAGFPSTDRHFAWKLYLPGEDAPRVQKVYRLDSEELVTRRPEEVIWMRERIEHIIGTSR